MQNIGICLPLPGYLEAVREITARHGTLLIFDEVKTGITAGYGGATGVLRRAARPDHARQVDRRWLPGRGVRWQGRVHEPHHHRRGAPPRHLQRQSARDGRREGHAHRGLHASDGRATIARNAKLSPPATRSSSGRASPPTRSSSAPRAASRGRASRSRNYRDYKATNFELAFAQWIHGINRGVLLPPGLDEQWLISVAHDDADAMRYATVFEEFVDELIV